VAVGPNAQIDLTTVADAAAWLTSLNITTPASDQLQQIVTATSASIQAWLGRLLIAATYSQVFDGRGTDRLVLPNSPITGVASLTINGHAILAAANAHSFGYIYSTAQEPPSAPWIFLRGCRFSCGVQNIAVTYTAGYNINAIPAGIAQACREGLSALTQLSAREPGLIEEKVGGLEEKYVAASVGMIELNKYILTPTVTMALIPYRRIIPAGG
jgi:hypothetical protein